MKNHINRNSIACAAIIGLTTLASNRAFAIDEVEPNSFPLSAQEIPIGSDGSPVLINGSTSTEGTTGGPDYFKITNTAEYTSINIHYIFSGSGPDTHRLRVLSPDTDPANVTLADELFNQLTSTGTDRYQASYTIEAPAKGAYFYISCWINSADGGTQPYVITITPSPNLDLLAEIEMVEAEIAWHESSIDKFAWKKSKAKSDIKQLKRELKITKKSADKKKIRKSIKKLNKKKSKWKVKTAKFEGRLENLEDELADLLAQLDQR